MKRSDKIRAANEATAAMSVSDDRDRGQRDSARREWGEVRKSAREAYLQGQEWKAILDSYLSGESFYTPAERRQMCDAYSDELINKTLNG